MTFWVGLIYLLITGSFTLPFIAFVCFLAFMTTITRDLLFLIKDAIGWVVNKFDNMF